MARTDSSQIDAVKRWLTEFRDQLTLGIVVALVVTALGVWVKSWNPIWFVVLSNLAVVGIVLLQRASMGDAMNRLKQIVEHDLGIPWQATQYSQRDRHFVHEKRKLAAVLVATVLPRLIAEIDEKQAVNGYRIILDSGTTITPVFTELMRKGLQTPQGNVISTDRYKIYTNNLAGISEVQKLDPLRNTRLNESDFTLIGGNPLSRYRATTGADTNQAIEALFDGWRENHIATIGVLTANWFLSGAEQTRLSLCAKGRGHLAFKKIVAARCSMLIIVTPLGKITALDDVDQLNELCPKDVGTSPDDQQYGVIELPETREDRDRTLLLTTRCPKGSGNPLEILSQSLFDKKDKHRKNFTLDKACPEFTPPGNQREVFAEVMPHDWTRQHAHELFRTP